MLTNMIRKVAGQNAAMLNTASGSFASNTVTYDFKDLILDPNQKGKPIYEQYRLEG